MIPYSCLFLFLQGAHVSRIASREYFNPQNLGEELSTQSTPRAVVTWIMVLLHYLKKSEASSVLPNPKGPLSQMEEMDRGTINPASANILNCNSIWIAKFLSTNQCFT